MRSCYILLFCWVCTFSINAQDESIEKRNYFIGVDLSFANPKGVFKENIGDLNNFGTIDQPRNSGFSINALFQSKRDPWLYMGFDVSNYLLDFEVGFDGAVNMQTSNNLSNAHYKIQLKYDFNSFLTSYAEGLLGAQYLYTRTVREDFIGEDVFRGSQIDRGDWGASFGGGIGLQLKVFRRLYLNTNVLYLRGTPTEYLVRLDDPPLGQDPLDDFEPRRSPTDLLVWKIGLQIGRR